MECQKHFLDFRYNTEAHIHLRVDMCSQQPQGTWGVHSDSWVVSGCPLTLWGLNWRTSFKVSSWWMICIKKAQEYGANQNSNNILWDPQSIECDYLHTAKIKIWKAKFKAPNQRVLTWSVAGTVLHCKAHSGRFSQHAPDEQCWPFLRCINYFGH